MTCDDLATVNGQIKAILETVHGSPLEVVLAIAAAMGVTDAATIAKCVGRTTRSVQMAKRASSGETGFAKQASQRNRLRETGFANEARFVGEAKQASPSKERVSPVPLPKEITTPPRTTVAAQYEDARESAAAATRVGSKDLLRKLQAAAGDCLDPTSFENQHCAAANGWISAGADLETDILPVIAAKARTLPRHSVSSFSYFAKPVARAVEMRKAGLPVVAETRYTRNDDKAELRRKNDAIFAKYTRRAEASA